MSISAKILEIRDEISSKCYLAKFSLFDYLSNLPGNYKEYEIQREVVSTNVYLDKIIDTILAKKHIPTIVIVLEKYQVNDDHITFAPNDYKIIDGLQRTHRLKIIFDTIELLKRNLNQIDEIVNLKKFELSKKFSKELSSIKSNYKILEKIIIYYKSSTDKDLDKIFKDNYLWFELWTNLSSQQQVEKMLLLNAGHKPVKLKHQLELLFINDLLKDFKNSTKYSIFELVREKDMNSTSFSKNRELGQFHFSQIISSLIAFDIGRPIVTNASLVSKVQDNDYTIQDLNNELSYDYITNVVDFLLELDKLISTHYPNEIKWIGRETSLVGIFSALGNYRLKKDINPPKIVFDKLINFLSTNPQVLNLSQFDENRKILDLSKINYGNVNRKVINEAFNNIMERIDNLEIFPNEPINWKQLFINHANL